MNRNLYVHFTFQFLYFDLCIDLLNLQNADGSYNFDQESVVNPETKEKVVIFTRSSALLNMVYI